ncbi:hypothetical protein Pint_03206 [Pistacia integerrima]|uniref:Uncharacterized protein n=1 Tax=Pistacia integerrima TaxID=434235 RepID=A0ACC0ZI16_9ROSI|nr:hypothetical protein Pint_03206 [Pistacia integerrima]
MQEHHFKLSIYCQKWFRTNSLLYNGFVCCFTLSKSSQYLSNMFLSTETLFRSNDNIVEEKDMTFLR